MGANTRRKVTRSAKLFFQQRANKLEKDKLACNTQVTQHALLQSTFIIFFLVELNNL